MDLPVKGDGLQVGGGNSLPVGDCDGLPVGGGNELVVDDRPPSVGRDVGLLVGGSDG